MKTSRDTTLALTSDYKQFVTDLKSRIASARLSAARHVNREQGSLYWDIGEGIVEKQKTLGWGESVVEVVAADLRDAFPDMSGFSSRNVWDMKRLFEVSPDFLSQVVRELSRKPQRPILRQAVAELSQPSNRPQAVAKLGHEPIRFLRQLVAEIP